MLYERKIILTHCDGVVALDWEEGFSIWMEHPDILKLKVTLPYEIGARYGMSYEAGSKLVKQFNESA